MKGFSRPTVLFLGAGATRGSLDEVRCPPPVDLDFFDIVARLKSRGTGVLAKKVLNDVFDLYRKTSGVSLEDYYRDIESRAEVRVFTAPGHRHKDWERRKNDLKELIRRVCVHTTTDMRDSPPTPKPNETHGNIFHLLEPKDKVITSNYDLVIEESLLTTGLWNPVGGYGIEVSKSESEWLNDRRRAARDIEKPLPITNSVAVLKLHGSINWRPYGGNKVRIKQRPYNVSTSTRGNAFARFERIEILSPGWQKDIMSKPYFDIWRLAGKALRTCKSLVIIGYSLPETDLLAKALFSEVIRIRETHKEWLLELHLADPSERVRLRFIEMFAPLLHHNGKVFQYKGIKEVADRYKRKASSSSPA